MLNPYHTEIVGKGLLFSFFFGGGGVNANNFEIRGKRPNHYLAKLIEFGRIFSTYHIRIHRKINAPVDAHNCSKVGSFVNLS